PIRHLHAIATMIVLLLGLPGCLLVRTSEHIITLNEDGSGEGVIRLFDIRSDGQTDSLVKVDFDDLMVAYGSEKVAEFERLVREKQLPPSTSLAFLYRKYAH